MGKKSFSAVLALGLFASPLAANAEMACPMMAGKTAMAAEAGWSAQARSCCPKGACDCSVEAPSAYPAVPAQISGHGLSFPADFYFESSTVSADAAGVSSDSVSTESPPSPDKPYKLTSQYRI